ncbi:MAG: hypothetical protein U1F63_12515 [Chitinivorax sp.]
MRIRLTVYLLKVLGAAGFTDVRLIDASAFNGKLAFTAANAGDLITKYVNQVDTQANPTADVVGSGNVNFNVKGANFIYTGGTNDDTMSVTIDGGVAASQGALWLPVNPTSPSTSTVAQATMRSP